MSSSRLLLVALALLGALLALPLGAGETIIVDASGNGDYTTITAGLEAAADGDVVRVWNGTYVESSLLIEKQVTLRGNGSATTLQPQQGDDFITIASDDVELSHLHLESPDGNAWALVSGSNDGLRLESLNISGKYLIRLDRSDGGLLANLTLTVTEASGRALELDSSDGNIIRDSVFAEPASGSGYGIMLEDSDDNLLRNCTVSSFGYYGIYLYNSARDNTILDSSADSNGDAGLMLEVAYNTVVRNSSFSGSPNGSGLIVTSATGVALDNLTVADNGDETSDYGLSVSSSSQITLKFSSFSNNSGIGTYIYNSNNIVIYSNRMVDHQSHTLQLWTVNDALVARNILESGSGDVVSAVSLYYTTDTWIENNSVTQQGDGPEDSGIGLRYSYGNTIYNNSIGDSDATGIRLRDDSNSNFVIDNHLLRLKGYGIQVSDGNRPSLYNLVSGNILEEIDQYALYVATKGAWNTFSGNAISDSEAQGIGVFGADNTFSGNSISGGLAAAIIDDGQRNSFTGNSIDATGQTAIIVYASGGTYSNNSITNGLEGFLISGSDNLFVNETVVVSS
ncbi:MAG: right-handed parallel beta-helix repeat-containing protein, partial [Candidatus Poseidoniia archaeon]|nr:right-handed parallel beta-helix repeat-containing protein [Candidatus Poseidoniia archaeon]